MKSQSNNAATAANNSNNWKNEVNEIRARLEAVKTRSCWDRGVKGFALDLLESYENICEYCENNGQPIPELNEETLLNGADDWNAYCYGGGALIYNGDIAEALCTPSMLKKKRRRATGSECGRDLDGCAGTRILSGIPFVEVLC